MNPEAERLEEISPHSLIQPWEKWGPFVAERAWGTVREDYSADGDAWKFFPHDHARRRAFRWGDDGIAGFCDRMQVLLLAPAFWNGEDPIIKERLFGLDSEEGNHGEDVKELYYYLDGTPTGSYMKYLYKYPQKAYPYDHIVAENGHRTVADREYELLDTGIFEENRYFDIYIEYAKQDTDDICVRIEAINRGPEAAPLHLLPQLWFRNQWAWKETRLPEPTIVPSEHQEALWLIADDSPLASPHLLLFDYHLGKRNLYASLGGELLFTDNDTNNEALYGLPNQTQYVKDGFDRYLVHGETGAVNPEQKGTKAAVHYVFTVAPGESAVVHLRLTPKRLSDPLKEIDSIISKRKEEADQFYDTIHPKNATAEEKSIQRQAFAGMNWNKQIYLYSVGMWLRGEYPPPPPTHKTIRNFRWGNLYSMKILSMPDKWEYPWFASWDLAFHTITFALMDIQYAKMQLLTLFSDQFQHPNGQIPAYEWEFSDVNPPVQAWAALQLFEKEKKQTGHGDYDFLEKCFHRLLLNFSWWVNKVDSFGNNVFEGGFLGMDNIGLRDRSERAPPGYHLDEVDGSGWMSLLCLNMMRIALILAKRDHIYEGMAIKFLFHFVYVTAAMRNEITRDYDLWNEADGFFYSYLRHPDGTAECFRIRSLVGVIPFFACDVWEEDEIKQFPEFHNAYQWLILKRPDLADKCIQQIPNSDGCKHLFGLLSAPELTKFLGKFWDPEEFRSNYGLRSISKYHQKHPFEKYGFFLSYEPGEAQEKIKGGNSNWRGPIWFPINYLFIHTLQKLGNAFKNSIQVQVDGEPSVTIPEMALYYNEALLKLFKQNEAGRRPYFGDQTTLQNDPHFKDHILFYEHFHAETGRGLGASHQTGWTGLIANIIDELRK